MIIKIVNAAEFELIIPRSAEILRDAVDSGASVSFLKPHGQTEAENFWRS